MGQSLDGASRRAFLKQSADSPTREGAILHLVLGNEPGLVANVSVGEQFGNSDHNSISFTVLMGKDKCSPQVKMLNWGKANYKNVRQELMNVHWGQMFEGKSASGMWEAFKCKLIEIQDRHVPVRMRDKYGKFREPWLTRDSVCLVRKKKEAFIKARRSGTHEASVENKESIN